MAATPNIPPLPSLEALLPSELHMPLRASEIGPFYMLTRAAWYSSTPCELPLTPFVLARAAGVDEPWWACSGHIVLDAAGMVPDDARGVATFPNLLALFRAAQDRLAATSAQQRDRANKRWCRDPGRPPPGGGLRLVMPGACRGYADGMPAASTAPSERSSLFPSESARAPALQPSAVQSASDSNKARSAGARAPGARDLGFVERTIPGERWRHTEYDPDDKSPAGLEAMRDVLVFNDVLRRLRTFSFDWADAGCTKIPEGKARAIAVDRRITPMYADWILEEIDRRGRAGRVSNGRNEKNPNGLLFQAFGIEPPEWWVKKWAGKPDAPPPPIWDENHERQGMTLLFVKTWRAREQDRERTANLQAQLEAKRRAARAAREDENDERREAHGG